MKRLVIATALMCVLVLPAAAGDIHTGDAPIPGPSPTPQGMRLISPPPSMLVPGDLHGSDPAQPTVNDVLSAILSVFGLVF